MSTSTLKRQLESLKKSRNQRAKKAKKESHSFIDDSQAVERDPDYETGPEDDEEMDSEDDYADDKIETIGQESEGEAESDSGDDDDDDEDGGDDDEAGGEEESPEQVSPTRKALLSELSSPKLSDTVLDFERLVDPHFCGKSLYTFVDKKYMRPHNLPKNKSKKKLTKDQMYSVINLSVGREYFCKREKTYKLLSFGGTPEEIEDVITNWLEDLKWLRKKGHVKPKPTKK